MIRAHRIIVDSIKDHLIPQVSSNKTSKEMYDALSRMYEGRNINIKMNLRAQLKSTKMSHGESIQDYFTRVSQIKDRLEVIGRFTLLMDFLLCVRLTYSFLGMGGQDSIIFFKYRFSIGYSSFFLNAIFPYNAKIHTLFFGTQGLYE